MRSLAASIQRGLLQRCYGLEIIQEQCVACELSFKRSMKKKGNGEVYRLRWQAQEDFCCVSPCSSVFLEEAPILVD